ncbi:MAG: amidohydrolase [Candidatus Hodarchaeota archaeon]
MKVIQNARVLSPSGKIQAGLAVLFDRKIVEVGKNIEIPSQAEIIDAEDCYLSPGLIDCHSHLGLFEDGAGQEYADGNELTDPVTPALRAIDAVNPRDRAFHEALRGGITAIGLFPGSGNVIGGQGATMKTFAPRGLVSDIVLDPFMGMKMALGENPIRVYRNAKRSPTTRMAEAALIREALIKTQDYLSKREKAQIKENTEKCPEKNLGWEALAKVLDRTVPACIHAHRGQDLETAIRLSEEFEFRLILEHASEAHRIIDLLKETKTPCVLGPTFNFRTKLETREKTFDTHKLLFEYKIPFAITLDHPVIPLWFLNVAAGLAVRDSLPEAAAFKAITTAPAEFLGQDDRLGQITPGFDADLVLWDGHPLQSMSRTKLVFVEGQLAYDRKADTGPDWIWYS